MRYEKQIQDAYARLGYQPRDKQIEHIDRILTSFLDEGYKNVILSAPTGTGKSIIGAVTAEVLHSIKYPEKKEGASFLLTATNVLAQQYAESFQDEDNPRDLTFHIVKGAGNYVCEALTDGQNVETAESCAVVLFRKSGMDDVIQRFCDNCDYAWMKNAKNKSRHLITNYSYYFVDRMYSPIPMPPRTLCVFDEAHLLNDLFTEHNSIYFSENRIKKCIDEVADNLKLGNTDVFKNFKIILNDLSAGKINDKNYKVYLKTLLDTYMQISDSAKVQAEQNIRSQSTYLRLSKLSKKYHNLSCKIDDLFIFEYPHVFEYKEKDVKKTQNEHEVSVKPIFISDMFSALENADYNLLMSATISESFAKRTMTLDAKTKHLRLEPSFPIENKKAIFFKPMALNYNTMKDPQTVKKLSATTYEIVKHHTDKNERGIILAPSFVIVKSIAETLRVMGVKTKIFEHERGQKLADVLEAFKAYKQGPAVILTPSGFEGVDLPGDLSRYQIIVKAPFGSLGDKRMKVILDSYPDIYALQTLMKITQGAGRSVRSSTDHATTYFLDTAIQRLWTSNNEWSDEFKTSFTSTLQPMDD